MESLIQVAVPFGVAAAVSAVCVPIVSRIAISLGIVDRPNERKVNRREGIPLLGGLAVAAGCGAGLLCAAFLLEGSDLAEFQRLAGFALGGLILLVVGVFDDRFAWGAVTKLAFQVGAAIIAIDYGFKISYVSAAPFTNTYIDLPEYFVWPITILWVVGVTNAINLLDGLDGLATGLGAIMATTLAVLCYQADQGLGVVLGAALVGALLGFLPFNFSPARIFLGDAGALFIGFSLSVLALAGYRKAALLTFVVPVMVLAVPILDTLLSILRRVRSGKSILSPDRNHMHHRLLQKEGSHAGAVLQLYFMTACFSLIAVRFGELSGAVAFAILGAVVVLTVRLLINLGIFSDDADETNSARPGVVGGDEG